MLLEKDLTYRIRGGVYEVFNQLGGGFLEKVYEKALAIELSDQGLEVKRQYPIKVSYKGTPVGEYIADLVVENKIIIELKAQDNLLPIHEAQIINYLKATDMKVGLLINFKHPKAEIKRFVV